MNATQFLDYFQGSKQKWGFFAPNASVFNAYAISMPCDPSRGWEVVCDAKFKPSFVLATDKGLELLFLVKEKTRMERIMDALCIYFGGEEVFSCSMPETEGVELIDDNAAVYTEAELMKLLSINLTEEEKLARDFSAKEVDMTSFLTTKRDLTYGVPSLDRIITPLSRRTYSVLVGETGAGKTVFAFQMAIKNARLGHRVLYISLEMGNDGLLGRYVLRCMNVSKLDWKDNRFDLEKFELIKKNLPDTLFFKNFDGVEKFTTSVLTKIIKQGNYDMVIIDNFGFIEPDQTEEENQHVKRLSRELVKLKTAVNTCIIALHHFRKGKSGQRGVEDVLGSAKIAHDVDFLFFLFRDQDLDEDAAPEEKAKLLVTTKKDRAFGDNCTVPVFFVNGEFREKF